MRLIHAASLEFHEFEESSSSIPPYAILSHTWGDDEVTFHDMLSGPTQSTTKNKKRYDKIKQTCRLAREDKLEYVWIDTCCIDKSSSAELSESINSMFEWYANSAVCYVFLFDYIHGELGFKSCSWWTRGWTLQELLAPKNLVFYDAMWAHAGTKMSRVNQIHEITQIQVSVLLNKLYIFDCPVSQRMSWAASRQTTRIEDEAYCLFGIFGIHLPLIYGEGRMAFRRLQEEIIKRNADLSIFFWHTPIRDNDRKEYLSLLAESPSNFHNAMFSTPDASQFPEFFITNKGVLFSDVETWVEMTVHDEKREPYNLYGIALGGANLYDIQMAIPLRKVSPGLFYRTGRVLTQSSSNRIHWDRLIKRYPTRFYIITDPTPILQDSVYFFRRNKIHVPHNAHFQLSEVAPRHLWDATDRVFLYAPKFIQTPISILVTAFNAVFRTFNISLVVLVQAGALYSPNWLKVFQRNRYPNRVNKILRMNPEKILTPEDLMELIPDIELLHDYVDIELPRNEGLRIRVSLEPANTKIGSEVIDVSDVTFHMTSDQGREESHIGSPPTLTSSL
ncbi:hypothetical protein O1611_g5262 [Lasiodiplodia mahajangana]|uniref:Uncharacterized protein n=1 Tax=Lasiodiplodia mahajangana TaxID=1108764 RepID=A0ACC2JLI6_9PEZI|nr:hypothetical protein O1611_g5262 [Lasiodiplodia mahajangana]